MKVFNVVFICMYLHSMYLVTLLQSKHPYGQTRVHVQCSTSSCTFLLVLKMMAGPTWLKNLYFAYTVVLRAIIKAAPFWELEQFYTGDYEDDLHVQELVQALLAKSK